MRKAHPPIRDATKAAVLDAAWTLMATEGRLDAGMAEIAAAAGVTRQTLFYAFGNRAGLLLAMVRHKDTQGDFVERMSQLAGGGGADTATLLAFVDAWLEYLPVVYPVAIQLEAASLTDADAAVAWNDRIFAHGVRLGLDRILGRMAAAGALGPGADATRLADLGVALLAPSAWRMLVVDRGWTAAEFAASRHQLLRAALGAG